MIVLELVDRNGTPICIVDRESDLLSETEWFRLYRVMSPDRGRKYLLRVPLDASHNGDINLEAEMLSFLSER